ncbi:hypothetical protein QTH91_01975 [Variovorax dokdonensis]|uniref:Serine/threonine protein kinase n=1 Tax=Variovorax dokdonensis TaxID=344883 RepID=A0ABT7N5P9_9BURK|nr:hypothetical protein [Variovorax dokdonensis]MDM0043240.1 hypothetical protein [Variovorax dokdonensis]
MRKLLSIAVAGMFAAGAVHAQTNPPGSAAPPHSPGVANSKSQQAAEMHKDQRADKPVNQPGGDMPKSAESTGMKTDKATMNADQRVMTRDAKNPAAAPVKQGSTPK